MTKDEEIKKLKKKIEELEKKNDTLQDELDSVWLMLDEITKADQEEVLKAIDKLGKDVVSKALMVTKKVGEA
tara:strand:+ start:519 stop:734 length:216 start_codon:yes stop_codon:yes gene_type:complete